MTDWVPIDCRFATNLQLAELKELLPPGVVMQNGFLCVPKNFDNQKLHNYFTALFGINNQLIQAAPTSQTFFDCFRDAFLCDWFASRFSFDEDSGTGTLSTTAPAGGEYLYYSNYNGAQDGFASLGTDWVYETDDDDQGNNGSEIDTVIGGLIASTVVQPGAWAGKLTTLFIRIDC